MICPLPPVCGSRSKSSGKKRTDAKEDAEAQLKRAQELQIGAEIGHGTLERTVEVKVGDNLEALMGAEILTEDGKIIAFRM